MLLAVVWKISVCELIGAVTHPLLQKSCEIQINPAFKCKVPVPSAFDDAKAGECAQIDTRGRPLRTARATRRGDGNNVAQVENGLPTPAGVFAQAKKRTKPLEIEFFMAFQKNYYQWRLNNLVMRLHFG